MCDGVNGCCSADDMRASQRQNGQMAMGGGPHQACRPRNDPRGLVDWNGDVWIANRAFGGQSSVTKIANDAATASTATARHIETSSDVNGDGAIATDCNADAVPETRLVQAKACANGKSQEFFGLDDDASC